MELSLCFISSEGMILQIKMPLTVHLLRVMVRNLVVLLHNIVIIPIVMVFFKVSVGWDALLLIPGIALLILALFPIGLISSIFCSRFRDMSQVVQNILQLSFYATPIMWFASALPGGAYNLVLLLNPFYHLLAVIRGPLLGEPVEIISWIICLCLVLVSWITAFIFFARYQKRIPFWL
jgi:lipopolysaccharide transport system permease protein